MKGLISFVGDEIKMLSVAHNLSAMNAQRQFNIVGTKRAKSTEKLSSGYRINRAADDAAGLAISEKMRRQIRGLHQGTENTQDGISWLQIGDGAMGEVTDMIHRMEELAVKAANETLTDIDRSYIDLEVQQLKSQINSIARNTVFNEMNIFDNDYVEMVVEGTPSDMSMFNATYNDATGEVSWGGFIFHGERVAWNQLDSNMVTLDPYGKQIFTGGDYTYTAPTGETLKIHTEPGDKPPEVTRTISLSGNTSAFNIDGTNMAWASFKDENDESMSESNFHEGTWKVDYNGMTISYIVPSNSIETLDDLKNAILSGHSSTVRYTLTTEYDGSVNEKAVDITDNKTKTKLTNADVAAHKAALLADNFSYTLGASAADGIWLIDENGTEIAGTKKSWADVGISSWNSGKDINSGKTYEYKTTVNGEQFSFYFRLSDETSVDSIIDGLNGAQVKANTNKTQYRITSDVTLDSNIKDKSNSSQIKNYDLAYEINDIGRDFDVQKYRKDLSSTTDATYKANALSQMNADVQNFIAFVENMKIQSVLNNTPLNLKDNGLPTLLGSGNITASNYFDSTVTINDATMLKTHGNAGVDGKTYPTAYVDFQNITSANIDSLLGMGFNSTCKTCSNHYSLVFTNGVAGGAAAGGVKYNKTKQGSNDYLLQIDLQSLKAAINTAVAGGKNYADALAESVLGVLDDCYDFHYTQYAVDGSKLYIYDNRESAYPATDATFDTKPYGSDGKDKFNLRYSTTDTNMNVSYTYDYSDSKDLVDVTMNQASGSKLNDGTTLYEKQADGSYSLFAGDPTGRTDLYYVSLTYKDINGNTVADRDALAASYANKAVDHMINATKIYAESMDYAYLAWQADEKANVSVKPNYVSNIRMDYYDNSIYIVHSGQTGDKTGIPRFAMTTAAMGLYNAGTKNVERARKTMGYTKTALQYVSSRRSAYGALQNRMEHTINNNQNKEENLSAAESRIRDMDMAKGMVDYSLMNILNQVGISVMTQANQSKQGILTLLQ